MKKFTVFTVLLTIVIVVVAAETFVNKYLPAVSEDSAVVQGQEQTGYNLPSELDLSAAMQSNVLGADSAGEATDGVVGGSTGESAGSGVQSGSLDFLTELEIPTLDGASGEASSSASGSGVFDIEDFSSSYEHAEGQGEYLRNDQIVNSGFVGAYMTEEGPDGLLYKSINIGDLVGVSSKKYSITNGTTTFAKVYVVIVDNPLQVGGVYDVLKVRAAEGVDIEINETNQFGSASFYMNDLRRDSVAFLTVRVGSRIYGFSYPKQYHPQIKNLVSILMLDGR